MNTTTQFQTNLLGIQENMMNLALTLTANKDDAQDLFQETTLRVLDNQKKFTDNGNFKGWVLTVMRNIFINNYHKVVRIQSIMDQNADIYNLDTVNQPDFDSIDSSNNMDAIKKAIDSLSKEMKSAFCMYISGYRYDEIAAAQDVPVGTVKSRIHVARQELQKNLRNYYS